jgi:excinuclease ABC subunit B
MKIEKLRLSNTSSYFLVVVIFWLWLRFRVYTVLEIQQNFIKCDSDRNGANYFENSFLHKLVQALYSRTEGVFQRGNFRIKGDTLDIFLLMRMMESELISLVMKSKKSLFQ